jgi:hypothetical protein
VTAPFWTGQPDAVVAVLDLAGMRELDGPDIAHDRVLALLLSPAAADTVREIATALDWIERLETYNASEVLSAYYERPVHGIYLDRAADVLADELRADVVTKAQLVASTVLAGRRAAA